MKERKNIDRLFQEKFKDFEATPPEMVWDNIHQALQGKKKRRVVPLWFKLGGAAAVLILGFLLLMPFGGNNVNNGNNPVVTDENNDTPATAPGRKPAEPYRNLGQDGNTAPNVNSAIVIGEGETAPTRSNTPGNGTNSAGDTPAKQHTAGTAVAQGAGGQNSNSKANSSGNTLYPAGRHNNRGYAAATGAGTAPGNAMQAPAAGNNNTPNNTATPYGQNNANGQGALASSGDGRENNNPDNTNAGTITGTEGNGSSIINNAVITDEAVAVTDTATVPLPENELDKLLQEKLNGEKDKDENAVADNGPKWDIRPQVAPLFYNSLSQGSPIDMQFAGNAKSYDNTLSYGLGINYALTDKLSLRSGINRVDLNYSTQDVQFYASLNNGTNNIAARTTTANIVVQSTNASNPDFLPGIVTLASDQLPQEKFQGSMIQEMGYIEVPLEMSYALLNKKFGIQVIGGLSTLFLNNNNVSVINTQGQGTSVGEAQNLNNVHFSTNVGLGFKYRFFQALEANFEPMFKYQVNTFSNNAGNFKPYFIGLYSGISFSF